ncbi:hypothetical protein LTR14_000075 [Exophiala xenobiotica]|nr:hypothetical protein LTR14_000075 [Exophiala xenobiotica]
MDPSDDPETHSAGSDESDEGEQHHDVSGGNTKKPRSSRACVACRRMKTRCEIDDALGTACKLCIRARRQCIMQTLPRRRKRKTTDRVADLERKINTLTALLASNESAISANPSPKSAGESISSRHKGKEPDQPSNESRTLIAEALHQGLFDWPAACKAFDRYRKEMCLYFPFVVFPATADANVVKEQQPLLFFAICTVAMATMKGPVKPELWDMLTKDLSLRIMYRGERSLELVQVLLIHITWYTRAKEMRELNFNQMVHVACAMGLDIGLGRRSHKSAQSVDPHHLESLAGRRAWLGCYYMGTNIAMSLRHPAFVRWSVYIEECLDVLSSESGALPSDQWLCDLIRIQHIAEDASVVFSMDDPGSIISFRDVKTQYQIGGFRQQLKQWRRHAHNNLQQAFVRHIEATTTLYVHEIAIHSEHNIDELRSPLRLPGPNDAANLDPSASLTDLQFVPARIESLFTCVTAIHECFDALLSMDLTALCTLPNFFLVRTGYAARALRKLLSICENQAALTGQFQINVQDLKFDEYMTSLIHLFARIHEENSQHVARAFCLVISQIKAHGLRSLKAPDFTNACMDDIRESNEKFDKDSAALRGFATTSVGQPTLSIGNTARTDASMPPAPTFSAGLTTEPWQMALGQPSFGAFDSAAPLPDLPLWLQVAANDSTMSGEDVLQWFEHDFAFDDLEMYGIGNMNYSAGTTDFQQSWPT